MEQIKELVDENVTLEQLKRNPVYSNYPDDILELLLVSGKMAKKYKSEQEIPQAPNALKCYKWYKKEVESYTKQIQEAECKCEIKSSCQKGCAYCCKQLIVVTNIEMLALQLKIDNMSIDEKKGLRDIVNEQCQFLEQHGITNKSIDELIRLNIFPKNEQKLQSKYFDLNIKCPLLDEEDTCIFYEVRPINCWSYKNYGSSLECKQNVFVEKSIKFDDWERILLDRMLAMKKMKSKLWILQFALQDYLGK